VFRLIIAAVYVLGFDTARLIPAASLPVFYVEIRRLMATWAVIGHSLDRYPMRHRHPTALDSLLGWASGRIGGREHPPP